MNLKSQTEKIIWITLFWILISVLQFLSGYSAMIRLNFDLTGLSIITFLKGSIITGLIAGLIGGSSMVFYWANWLRTKSYGWSLLNILWSYTLVFILVATISGLFFYAGQFNVSFYHTEVWQAVWTQNTSVIQIQNYLFWLLIVVISLFSFVVNA